MKDLPHVYSNPIDKEIHNNKEYFYGNESDVRSPKDITRIANQIFSSKDFVYKKKVQITTFDDEMVVNLVGRTNTTLLTLDGKSIPIMNITDLKILD